MVSSVFLFTGFWQPQCSDTAWTCWFSSRCSQSLGAVSLPGCREPWHYSGGSPNKPLAASAFDAARICCFSWSHLQFTWLKRVLAVTVLRRISTQPLVCRCLVISNSTCSYLLICFADIHRYAHVNIWEFQKQILMPVLTLNPWLYLTKVFEQILVHIFVDYIHRYSQILTSYLSI